MVSTYNPSENFEEFAVDYVLTSHISACSDYVVSLNKPGRLQRAIDILSRNRFMLKSHEVFLHLIRVTDVVVCSISNPSLYPIYGSESVDKRMFYWLERLKKIWLNYFTTIKDPCDIEPARTALKLIYSWHLILMDSSSNDMFSLILQDGSTTLLKAIKKITSDDLAKETSTPVVEKRVKNENAPMPIIDRTNTPVSSKETAVCVPKKKVNSISNYFFKVDQVEKGESTCPPSENISPNSANHQELLKENDKIVPAADDIAIIDTVQSASPTKKQKIKEDDGVKPHLVKNAFSFMMAKAKASASRN